VHTRRSLLLCFVAILPVILIFTLMGCDEHAWNDPYPSQPANGNIFYAAFTEQPNHLDPAISYSSNEWEFIGQIYEPPLQYNYLKRPYTLEPLTAEQMPVAQYDPKTNTTRYVIKIKPGIQYQPHPAFAKKQNGDYYYHALGEQPTKVRFKLSDFHHTDTRELIAADYVYQIKRLADPKLNSPIFGVLSPYILGLDELHNSIAEYYNKHNLASHADLRYFDCPGVNAIDDYSYEVIIKGKYPQFQYWLAMPFFAPVPWESTLFYNQHGLEEHNITLDWYPIGTGAYYLSENNPDRRMVLTRNPNFHTEFYPDIGEPDDKAAGLLQFAGQKLPFIDKIIFSLEKENIPYWDKFLQGYYDASGISSDNFSSAITSTQGGLELTPSLIRKNIRLGISSMPSIFYWGFNMLDDTLGGYSEQARNLRKAISLAFDVDEYIIIFANGRGIVADGPIPPEIFGYQAAQQNDNTKQLQDAKKLLADAGYANGINPKTGAPLQINYEAISSGDPEEKAQLAWITKQLAKIGIDLIIRDTDYNRFMEKMRTGNAQMFAWGWNADYPDPENFLNLFYSSNEKVKFGGENAANYINPEYDKLFEQFKNMDDSPGRLSLINKMVAILQNDQPWIWGYFPQDFALYQQWDMPTKPSGVAVNTIKYAKIDPDLRAQQRLQWNKPLVWPALVAFLILLIIILPAVIGYLRSEHATGKRLH